MMFHNPTFNDLLSDGFFLEQRLDTAEPTYFVNTAILPSKAFLGLI